MFVICGDYSFHYGLDLFAGPGREVRDSWTSESILRGHFEGSAVRSWKSSAVSARSCRSRPQGGGGFRDRTLALRPKHCVPDFIGRKKWAQHQQYPPDGRILQSLGNTEATSAETSNCDRKIFKRKNICCQPQLLVKYISKISTFFPRIDLAEVKKRSYDNSQRHRSFPPGWATGLARKGRRGMAGGSRTTPQL